MRSKTGPSALSFLQSQTKRTQERYDRHAPQYHIDAFLPFRHVSVVIVADPDLFGFYFRSRRTIHRQNKTIPQIPLRIP